MVPPPNNFLYLFQRVSFIPCPNAEIRKVWIKAQLCGHFKKINSGNQFRRFQALKNFHFCYTPLIFAVVVSCHTHGRQLFDQNAIFSQPKRIFTFAYQDANQLW